MNRCSPLVAVAVAAVGVVAIFGFLGLGGPAPVEGTPPGVAPKASGSLRFLLGTMWSPSRGYERLEPFLECLEEVTGSSVVLVQRRSYAKGERLLIDGGAELGLVCTGTTGNHELRENFVPSHRLLLDSGDVYYSVLLVRTDDPAGSVEELAGAPIAWVDQHSLTGYRAPRAALRARGIDPDRFFGDNVFTYSHDLAIDDVAAGLVRVAAVDEQIVNAVEPAPPLRAVWRSGPFPSPPILVRRDRADLVDALDALRDRAECFAAFEAHGLVRSSWSDYEAVLPVITEGQ